MIDTGSGSAPYAAGYARRRESVAAQLKQQGIDILVVSDLLSVRYLCGFTGSGGALALDSDGGAVVCSDARYTEQLRQQVPDVRRVIDRRYANSAVQELLASSPLSGEKVVSLEADHLTHQAYTDLESSVREQFSCEVLASTGIISEIRQQKDSFEIAQIASACAIVDHAWSELLAAGELRTGRSEIEVAADLEYRMRKAGSQGVAFDTIVAAGVNSALPHHRPGARVICAGDFVTVDFGAIVDGYASDCTRTVVMGEPEPWQSEIYELVLSAQRAGVAAATAQARCQDVDKCARSIISDGGYGQYFGHSLGHGVGLDVHEGPALSQNSVSTLWPGNVVTIEPGIYLPDRGGVRIEDTIVVNVDGPQVLTNTSTELLVIEA